MIKHCHATFADGFPTTCNCCCMLMDSQILGGGWMLSNSRSDVSSIGLFTRHKTKTQHVMLGKLSMAWGFPSGPHESTEARKNTALTFHLPYVLSRQVGKCLRFESKNTAPRHRASSRHFPRRSGPHRLRSPAPLLLITSARASSTPQPCLLFQPNVQGCT